ncbi:ParB/RepB/Spo0J family partition protein [Erythrobacter sp. CCH5-A1]|jgi:ParB family chromosome partitioning protein|uniref:ParB/RepB/Spo0J family partition protein n=1 Tax=Erythrobacter sp. CCH5-A1 TaxID=1768792 RepID=UPI000B18ABA9|nr:ParB/RepB/Spo0J family partition protein [Erythrobacter sp. CCH5-A1]
MLIPFSKLYLSDANVRKTRSEDDDAQLSADIEARGLLQNLLVTKSKKRGKFAVIAGGRRLRAIEMIIERGAWTTETEIECKLLEGSEEDAGEASLAENFQRVGMTPAEECRAFEHFIKEGTDIAGVAKRFGLTQRFVEGRLRLANLAEPIFEALAAGEMTLEIAKAYAATDQHEVQLRVYQQMRTAWNTTPDAIRRMVANGSMRGNDPIAMLIGEDAYVAAGGRVERDLFSEAADDRWIDTEVAHKLAGEAMEAEATRLAGETGLGWITPVASTNSWQARSEMGVYPVRLPPAPLSQEARVRIDEIDARMDDLSAIFEEGEEAEDADFEALEAEYEALDTERSELNNPVRELPEEWRSEAGRFLVLTTRGEMVLEADYYSEKRLSFDTDEEGNVTVTAEEPTSGSGKRAASAPSKPEAVAPGTEKPISARLFDELSVQRRNILSASLLGDPGLALDFAIFALADKQSYDSKGTAIKGGRPNDPATGELPQSSAEAILAEAAEALDKSWQEPAEAAQRFIAFRELEDDAKAAWLAYAVAISLEAKKGYGSEYHPIHAVLGTMLDIDVAQMWRPTAENFFDRVSKTSCLAALTEVGGADLAARYAASKKAELSKTCETIFAGKAIIEQEVKEAALAWLPEGMKFALNEQASEPADATDEDSSNDERDYDHEPVDTTGDEADTYDPEDADEEAAIGA